MESHETRAARAFLSHHAFVKGLALRHAPWPGLAEDILQQVFVEFLDKAAQWDLKKDARPLLATMTRQVALRHWREKTRLLPEAMRRLADHVRRLAEERDEPPRYEEDLTILRGCIEKLPDRSRSLLDLYYHAEVPTPEIASQMGMKADTVCRALCRLRTQLRECIDRTLQGGHAHA